MARGILMALGLSALLAAPALADGMARSGGPVPGTLSGGPVYQAPTYSGPVYSGPTYSGQVYGGHGTGSVYSDGSTYSYGTTTTVTRSDGYVTQYAPGAIVNTPSVSSIPPGYRTDSCETGRIAYGQQFVVCSGNWRLSDQVIISDVAPTYVPQHYAPAPQPSFVPAPPPAFIPAPQPTLAQAPASMNGGVGIDINGGFVGGGGAVIINNAPVSVAARSPIPIVIPVRTRGPAPRPMPPPHCPGGCGHAPPPPPPCGGGCGHH
jgi:hypothetical protein